MRLLRGADFRNLWLGETVSLFGDQVTLIALPPELGKMSRVLEPSAQ